MRAVGVDTRCGEKLGPSLIMGDECTSYTLDQRKELIATTILRRPDPFRRRLWEWETAETTAYRTEIIVSNFVYFCASHKKQTTPSY